MGASCADQGTKRKPQLKKGPGPALHGKMIQFGDQFGSINCNNKQTQKHTMAQAQKYFMMFVYASGVCVCVRTQKQSKAVLGWQITAVTSHSKIQALSPSTHFSRSSWALTSSQSLEGAQRIAHERLDGPGLKVGLLNPTESIDLKLVA